MQIDKNKVVSLTYTLTLQDGEVADTATEQSPFTFIAGIGQTLPQFDSNLSGLKAGDDFDFEIEAEHGYGLSSEEYKVSVPHEIFTGPEVPADVLKIGNMVPMQDNHGNPMNGIILGFDDKEVQLDFNHPLADKKLKFQGKIISVRDSTADELSHGHVHGEGGHHH